MVLFKYLRESEWFPTEKNIAKRTSNIKSLHFFPLTWAKISQIPITGGPLPPKKLLNAENFQSDIRDAGSTMDGFYDQQVPFMVPGVSLCGFWFVLSSLFERESYGTAPFGPLYYTYVLTVYWPLSEISVRGE